MRNIYDRQRMGALRATADGVTGNPLMRVNMTISSTPFASRKFYKNDLFNGTFGRMVFSYKARTGRDGRIPRQGRYDDAFLKKVDEYLVRLDICKGRFVIRQLNNLIDRLAQDMATLADLVDDDVLWDMSKRSPCNCLESRLHTMGAEQPAMDYRHGNIGGVACLSRHLVEGAALRGSAQGGRQGLVRSQRWREEYA